jgi:GMP synthase-like glutamine amidotransferase
VHHPAEGLQFHPESILTSHGDAIIGNFVQLAAARRAITEEPGNRSARCGQ